MLLLCNMAGVSVSTSSFLRQFAPCRTCDLQFVAVLMCLRNLTRHSIGHFCRHWAQGFNGLVMLIIWLHNTCSLVKCTHSTDSTNTNNIRPSDLQCHLACINTTVVWRIHVMYS